MRKVLILCVLAMLTPVTHGAEWSTPSSWISPILELWSDVEELIIDSLEWIASVGFDGEIQQDLADPVAEGQDINAETAEHAGWIDPAG